MSQIGLWSVLGFIIGAVLAVAVVAVLAAHDRGRLREATAAAADAEARRRTELEQAVRAERSEHGDVAIRIWPAVKVFVRSARGARLVAFVEDAPHVAPAETARRLVAELRPLAASREEEEPDGPPTSRPSDLARRDEWGMRPQLAAAAAQSARRGSHGRGAA